MWQLLAVSLVTMALSHTVAKERIFEPLREKCGGKDTWLGYLLSCPYCASHWIAFMLVPLTSSYFLKVSVRWGVFSHLLDWFLSSVLVAAVAAFLRVGFYFIDERQGLIKREQRVLDESHPPTHH